MSGTVKEGELFDDHRRYLRVWDAIKTMVKRRTQEVAMMHRQRPELMDVYNAFADFDSEMAEKWEQIRIMRAARVRKALTQVQFFITNNFLNSFHFRLKFERSKRFLNGCR